MAKIFYDELPKSDRITRLVDHLYAKMPEIESARAKLITESYKATEGEPIVLRRAKAFNHILKNIPIIIRPEELIVGSTTIAPRGCQTYPEFSFEWLEQEFETVEHREADPFLHFAKTTKKSSKEADTYWKGKTSSELAYSYMSPEAWTAMDHNIFTTGNYYYNGVGHYTCQYDKVLNKGLKGVMAEAATELAGTQQGDADYARKVIFLQAVIIDCQAVIDYAARYADLAAEEADKESDPKRKQELLTISSNCRNVPGNRASHLLGGLPVLLVHPAGAADRVLRPFHLPRTFRPVHVSLLQEGFRSGKDHPRVRPGAYGLHLGQAQRPEQVPRRGLRQGFCRVLPVPEPDRGRPGRRGQGRDQRPVRSCASRRPSTFFRMPSLSIRVWNGSPHELLVRAADLARTGIGLPAFYNDEVIIPALMNRGIPLKEARGYSIIGCVEPQVPGKTDGWHDAAFFNMCRPLELVFSNGEDRGEQISIQTGEARG